MSAAQPSTPGHTAAVVRAGASAWARARLTLCGPRVGYHEAELGEHWVAFARLHHLAIAGVERDLFYRTVRLRVSVDELDRAVIAATDALRVGSDPTTAHRLEGQLTAALHARDRMYAALLGEL